ncbi:UDP-glucosyltransferase 2-like [Anticarsia gemmatalis]|uniref:UDP-glucosyltransferase 2-like n=1 Tax=Anticarsia gemmatalis TaxID=129554 RepID=UPI003F773C94
MANKITTGLLLLTLLASNEALKILISFPMITKSHGILGHAVADRLLEAGHQVTHITTFPREKPTPNLTDFSVAHVTLKLLEEMNQDDIMTMKNMIGQGNFGDSFMFPFFAFLMHKKILEDPATLKLINEEKFDVVILEYFFSELLTGIPALMGVPLIWFCSTEPHWQALRLIDSIPNPAYNVDVFATYGAPLDFWQRVDQMWRTVTKFTKINFGLVPMEWWTYNSVYPEIAAKKGVTLPSYSEAAYNGSFMFINSHPSLGGAIPLPQNAFNIAGYHVADKPKPLPKDLQTIMDEAKDGVIYFSLGSFMSSDGMTDEMKASFINMLSKFKETIIWKFDSEMEAPANIHFVKWAPQQSVLAHPNLKLFITHGGQLSLIEAMHYGVPLVGIPLFADQYINMAAVERKGAGIKVSLAEDMAIDMEVAIRKVLTDDSYRIRAKELSEIYHDRPMKPGKAISHWVEYVVKTRGAPHLRSPALSVNTFQRLHLDVLALFALVIVVVCKFVKFVRKSLTSTPKKSKTQ